MPCEEVLSIHNNNAYAKHPIPLPPPPHPDRAHPSNTTRNISIPSSLRCTFPFHNPSSASPCTLHNTPYPYPYHH
jgi:hypothetical protein